MMIRSARLGELDIPADDIIQFSHPIPGFPEESSFALLPYGQESPFGFLQSTSEPNLTFVVVEPFSFFKDYEFEIADDIARELGLDPANLPKIVNIVRIPENADEMTANLLAPIIINMRDRKARQFVLETTAYTTRHRLFPQGFPKNAAGEVK